VGIRGYHCIVTLENVAFVIVLGVLLPHSTRWGIVNDTSIGVILFLPPRLFGIRGYHRIVTLENVVFVIVLGVLSLHSTRWGILNGTSIGVVWLQLIVPQLI